MSEPLNDFSSNLADLIMDSLWSRAPPAAVAATLARASLAVIVSAELDFNSFLTDFEAIVDDMNRWQCSHLH